MAYDGTIEVNDFGRGISKEEIDRITEPFYRIDRSRNKKNGGVGLGLALVKRIADAHNIRLVIESELGIGTTVLLSFPDVDN
ncbi:Alkaline phosphatase synthesis sensor protein PhoR [bioreactor metagenome]|uniref:histidine kinase n=1 Tax=bioreactor metagenome TaxID=1076179 RepID=A0A645BPC3_9ZZZZ